jgi:hypothetical protein
LPAPPPVIVSQSALLEAVQAQPGPVETETFPAPPDAGTGALSGEIAKVHGVLPLPWLTATVWPATTTDPLRAEELAAILKVATPGPAAAAADVSDIHGAPLLAFHAHEGPVVTVTDSASPAPRAVKAPGLTL